MTDYQGQGEALVGWLDCFWDQKGNTLPESFRRYCNTVVPLSRFKKFVWETGETFEARLQVANYGQEALNGKATWMLTSGVGRIVQQGAIDHFSIQRGELKDIGSAAIKLQKIETAGKYTFSLTIDGTEFHNSWDIWIYPPVKPISGDVLVSTKFSPEVEDKLKTGGKVLLIANQLGTIETSRQLFFTPLFWSSLFFPGQKNSTLGLYVNRAHPALKNFPTDNYGNYQWEPITHGRSFVMNYYPELIPIAQPISDFHINDKLASIFECKVGKGKLIVCGYDILNLEDPVSRQMQFSLLNYMNESNCNPVVSIETDELKKILYYVPPVIAQSPKGFEKSILYIKCGNKMSENGTKSWDNRLDEVLTKAEECDYTVNCMSTWKKESITAWIGDEMSIIIKTPKGLIGDLFVKFIDPDNQNREGTVWLEGREMSLRAQDVNQGKWIKMFVMREDTNDGELILKTKATRGDKLMISEIGFIAE